MVPTQNIEWRADGSEVRKGWKLCPTGSSSVPMPMPGRMPDRPTVPMPMPDFPPHGPNANARLP